MRGVEWDPPPIKGVEWDPPPINRNIPVYRGVGALNPKYFAHKGTLIKKRGNSRVGAVTTVAH